MKAGMNMVSNLKFCLRSGQMSMIILGQDKRHHMLLELVVNLSGAKQVDTVLDIGCGTGLL